MDRIICRITRREVTQQVTVTSRDEPMKEQIRRIFVQRLRGVPSEWGMMVDENLISMEIGKFVSLESYGPQIYFRIPVKIAYNAVGFKVGDVVMNVAIAESVFQHSSTDSFRRASILGLPFQINVATTVQAPVMNIIITKARYARMLQYIAEPAFYPNYAPMAAHYAAKPIPSLYANTPKVERNSSDDMALLDPLIEMDRTARGKRICLEICYFVGFIRSGQKWPLPKVVNIGNLFGENLPFKADPIDGKAVIHFIHADDMERAHESYKSHRFTFVRVPSFPTFSPHVAAFITDYPLLQVSAPTIEQIGHFREMIAAHIDLYTRLAVTNREVYASKELRAVHLAAGEVIRKSISQEEIKVAPETDRLEGYPEKKT